VRKSRFNEEQIIAILKEAEAGIAPDQLCRRDGSERGAATATAGGGKPAVEARRGRVAAGQTSVEGGGHKKVVDPTDAEAGGGSDALGSCGFGATRLRAGEGTSGDMPVSAAKGRRPAFAGAVARAGGDPSTVWLSPAQDPAEARGLRSEP
jgi:hypothetical protein